MRANRRLFAGSLGTLGLLVVLVFIAFPSTPVFAHACPPGSVTSPDDPSITCVFSGFMTGGGRFNGNINNAPPPNSTIPLLVHGFILHCDPTVLPNNLEVNWKDPSTGVEHRFHLTTLDSAHCEMNPALGSPNPPKANFNTWVGNGTGRLDGVDGALLFAIFTDQSQPAGTQAGGPGDWSTIVIFAPDGTLMLNVTDSLFGGAQQAHECGGNC